VLLQKIRANELFPGTVNFVRLFESAVYPACTGYDTRWWEGWAASGVIVRDGSLGALDGSIMVGNAPVSPADRPMYKGGGKGRVIRGAIEG